MSWLPAVTRYSRLSKRPVIRARPLWTALDSRRKCAGHPPVRAKDRGDRKAIAPCTSTQLHAVRETRRRPVFELHAECETTPAQHILDFRQRLLAQVRRLQQLDFGLLDQVADVVDAFGLEAVGRTDRQFEIVDRTQQERIEPALLRLGRIALAAREIAENRQLVVDDLSRLAASVFSTDRTVRLA